MQTERGASNNQKKGEGSYFYSSYRAGFEREVKPGKELTRCRKGKESRELAEREHINLVIRDGTQSGGPPG